jgi:hypothetical protein
MLTLGWWFIRVPYLYFFPMQVISDFWEQTGRPFGPGFIWLTIIGADSLIGFALGIAIALIHHHRSAQ